MCWVWDPHVPFGGGGRPQVVVCLLGPCCPLEPSWSLLVVLPLAAGAGGQRALGRAGAPGAARGAEPRALGAGGWGLRRLARPLPRRQRQRQVWPAVWWLHCMPISKGCPLQQGEHAARCPAPVRAPLLASGSCIHS